MDTVDQVVGWVCYNCGHRNDASHTTCQTCQHTRFKPRETVEGPVRRPSFHQIPGFIPCCVWGGLAASGLAMLASPELKSSLGLGLSQTFLFIESAVTTSAFGKALWEYIWNLMFKRVEILVPDTVQARDEFEATVHLTPYRRLRNVTVSVDLINRYFAQEREGSWTMHTECRESYEVATRTELHACNVNSLASTRRSSAGTAVKVSTIVNP